jgi:hypothetical protein
VSPETHEMVLYAGLHRDQEETVHVRYLDGVAGEIDCIECDGTAILPPDNTPISRCLFCRRIGIEHRGDNLPASAFLAPVYVGTTMTALHIDEYGN